jgi:hypothetical protein
MKYIILCENNSLEFIHGRHIIEYVIESIPSNEIFIIYNIFLDEYNFQEILINKCKSTKIYFTQIDYITRGNVETALIGINNFNKIIGDNDNIVFIDNNLTSYCSSNISNSNVSISFKDTIITLYLIIYTIYFKIILLMKYIWNIILDLL